MGQRCHYQYYQQVMHKPNLLRLLLNQLLNSNISYFLLNQQQLQMANELISTTKARVFITLNEPVTYAGHYLQGAVRLQIPQDTEYKQIKMSLIGVEAISWSAELGKSLTSYQNKKQTYRQEFLLNRFDGNLSKGHYQFPFNILLPATLPATMYLNTTNHITYTLRAYLVSNDEKQQSPPGRQLSLNLREPLRMVSSLAQYGTATSECWKCLGPKQSGILHLQLQKNEIRKGQTIKLKGFIDNTNGQFSISRFEVALTRCITKISANGTAQTRNEDIASLIKPKRGVNIGEQKKFQAEIKLPQQMVENTAIGNIISRTFFVSLVAEGGCFYQNVRIEKHILVNNDIPNSKVTIKPKIQNWNPKISPCVSFISLKPYLFIPSPLIKIVNQKGSVSNSKLQGGGQFSIQSLTKENDF